VRFNLTLVASDHLDALPSELSPMPQLGQLMQAMGAWLHLAHAFNTECFETRLDEGHAMHIMPTISVQEIELAGLAVLRQISRHSRPPHSYDSDTEKRAPCEQP
jgi:hypothetical protein